MCTCINFKNVYDTINRDLPYIKLRNLDFHPKRINIVKSLYHDVLFYVKLNHWFSVNTGLQQGCSLSPIVFDLYINDVALILEVVGKGTVNVC